jgi:hypothetical protein
MDPAVMAIHDPIPAADEWTADDAFRHLTRVAKDRRPADQAIYELTESLLAGRVQAIRRYFVDGAPANIVPIPASLWRHRLVLNVDNEGRLVVLERPPSGVLGGGVSQTASGVFLSARDVECIWKRPSTATIADATPTGAKAAASNRVSTAAWCAAEAKLLKDAGEIHEGMRITEVAKLLEQRLGAAADIDKSRRRVKYPHIKNKGSSWNRVGEFRV